METAGRIQPNWDRDLNNEETARKRVNLLHNSAARFNVTSSASSAIVKKHALSFVSGQGGVSYRDFNLGSLVPTQSRTQFDKNCYLQWVAVSKTIEKDEDKPLAKLPSLTEICICVAADGYGEQRTWDMLQYRHVKHVSTLLENVWSRHGKRSRSGTRGKDEIETGSERDSLSSLPFNVWARFAAEFNFDVPKKERTYRGLCLSDTEELRSLVVASEEGTLLWSNEKDAENRRRTTLRITGAPYVAREILMPTFFLTIVDFASHSTLLGSELWKLKSIAPCLSVLRLDYTPISDHDLTGLMRGFAEEERQGIPLWPQLEVLSLRGLRQVTDRSAIKLALLPLRFLDLRDTSCTTAFRSIITKNAIHTARETWRNPQMRKDMVHGRQLIELELFGGSYTLSRILDHLHKLAVRGRSGSNCTIEKPISVYLNLNTRTNVDASTQTAVNGSCSACRSGTCLSDQVACQERIRMDKSHRVGGMFSGPNTAYSSVYGNITSTVSLSKKILREDESAETSKGAAFRVRNDLVAGGIYISAQVERQRADLYATQQREEASFSDSEDDAGELVEELEKDFDRQQAVEPAFYGVSASKREKIVAATKSELMLLRHLAPSISQERALHRVPIFSEEKPKLDSNQSKVIKKGVEGASLEKKRPKHNAELDPYDHSDEMKSDGGSSLPTADSVSLNGRQMFADMSRSSFNNSIDENMRQTARRPLRSTDGFKTRPSLPSRLGLSAFRTKG